MTDSSKYQIIKGRKFDKLAKVQANGHREAVAFIDQQSGLYRFAASWAKPGRFMNSTETSLVAAIVAGC
jgi:hypothetical protein